MTETKIRFLVNKQLYNDTAITKQLENLTNNSLIAYLCATLILCATIAIGFVTLKNILDEQSALQRVEGSVIKLNSALQHSSVTLSDLKVARSQADEKSRLPHKIALVLQSEIDTANTQLAELNKHLEALGRFDSFDKFNAMFNAPPDSVRYNVEQYIARAQDYAGNTETIPAGEETLWLPVEATIAKNGSLSRSYSKATSELSAIIHDRAEHLTKTHKNLSIISIGIVLLELVFLFYPLTRRYSRVSDNLSNAHEALHAQANFDQATGWLNTTGMVEKVKERADNRYDRSRNSIDGLLLVNIENLDKISEIVGITNLDNFFYEFSQRMSSVFRNHSALFRSGETEFSVVLTEFENDHYQSNAASLHKSITKRLVVGKTLVFPEISIGISTENYPGEQLSLARLHARLSAHAYNMSSHEITPYKPEFSNVIEREYSQISKIKQGISNNEFVPFYQIKVDAKTTKPLGMEALCRWIKPDGSMVSPGEFIELAERSGLIGDITWQLLETIASDFNRWKAKGLNPGRIAFNAAELILRDPEFETKLDQILQTIDTDVCPIDMEITENVATGKDMDKISSSMDHARQRGVGLALDDFGTGFASLSTIVELDFDTIKVDQSFVRNIDSNEKSKNIVIAIINLSNQLQKKCVAEGVETQEQWEFCRDLDCDEIQGYFFHKPLPAQDIDDQLETLDAGTKAA